MKVDFYILEAASSQKSLHFTCGLIEKIYQEQKPIYIHTASSDDAKRLDLLLWTYKEDSFLPHNLYDPQDLIPPLIQIGFDVAPELHNNILINLSTAVPAFYLQFKQVIEIVFSDPTVQQLARERFKYYREKNYEIITHKLKV